LSGARIIEAIAGATSTQAVSSTVARIRLQKFLACFPMYASLVILVAVLTVVSLAIQIASLFRSASLQFLTASRVARNASPEEERPLAKRSSAAVLAFVRMISPPVNFAPQATHRGIG